ncbi:immunoglobulin superfamily member 1-like [Pelodiscus sinensis]|uniref:immunoglobulin superfamily member 1-like n=1 Tax=Pelodiscus sinensis TaxID=13735 RepID=UPI003F6A5B22
MAPTRLLPLLASLQMLPWPVSPEAPQFSVSPEELVYVTGETVTLSCSTASTPAVSRFQFFRDDQQIYSRKYSSPQSSDTHSIQLSGEPGSQAGLYSCAFWKTESRREIQSERSQKIRIKVTDRLPAPQLTVSPPQTVYIAGEAVNLTCSAASAPAVSGIRFFKDSQQILSKELALSHDSNTKSLSLSNVSALNVWEYSCESWKTVSGQEIKSTRSRLSSIRVAARPPAPKLSVSSQHRVFLPGEYVTLMCWATSTDTASGIRFFRDGKKISSGELQTYQSNAKFHHLSSVSETDAGAYSCESWKKESGREIPSERSQTISITVTAWPPALKLTVSSPYRVFLHGESVTLTCSAPSTATVSRIRFFRDGQEIDSGELQPYQSKARSHQLLSVSESDAGEYSCESWKKESEREIPSERSQTIFITVTDPPPQPELSVDPLSGVVSEGFSLNITCTAPGNAREWRFHFYKDGAELVPGDLGSKISTMEPSTSSVKGSVLSVPWAGSNITGEFTCGYEENVAGRWILSPRSWTVNVTGNITGSDSQRIRDILLGAGGILLLIAILAALLCYCCRKKRVPKTPKSADESAPREHARNLDPSHDTKGSKAAGAGAEQMKQGSEVTYALLALPASKPHTTRSKNKSKPVEDEHVLYSEVVTTHNQKKAK